MLVCHTKTVTTWKYLMRQKPGTLFLLIVLNLPPLNSHIKQISLKKQTSLSWKINQLSQKLCKPLSFFDAQKNNSTRVTQKLTVKNKFCNDDSPSRVKKIQTSNTIKDEGFLLFPELQTLNTMATYKGGVKIMGEAYTIKTDQSLCLTTSLTSLDFWLLPFKKIPMTTSPSL